MMKFFTNAKKLKITNVICCTFIFLSTLFSPCSFGAKDDKYTLNSKVIVSLGDSFSSGEGIDNFYDYNMPIEQKVKSQDWLAHRSQNSWPGMLKLHSVSGTMKDHRNTNWFFVATSGAKSEHFKYQFKKNYNRDGEEGYAYIDPQLEIFENMGDKKADYVTFTIGGNDANFTGVVKDGAIQSYTGIFTPNLLTDKLNEIWDDFYNGGMRERIRDAYIAVEEAAGAQAKIIVAGYPKLMKKNGKGFFSKKVATQVNNSIIRFNDELEALVNSCKAEGMKICFVSVEDKFKDHEVGSDEPWINGIKITQDQDLSESLGASAYSMHPNKEGAKAYAEAVNEKIEQIEKDGGESEWPLMSRSNDREVVVVLDASGSMNGKPLQETKEASQKFVDTLLEEDASIGFVTYDNSAMTVADFCMNGDYLKNTIKSINSGGGTNIEEGLLRAEEMLKGSNAEKKIIVLMSDGEPNDGKIGDSLVSYADSLKEKGIYIYTLGFFENVTGNKSAAQSLMEKIASEGCHYEVDNADNLVFFFGDIADQIRGERYIYVRIACPVDVTVKYDGEKLSSKNTMSSQRTNFGTLTFEENPNSKDNDTDSDDRVKILRLKEGSKYDIEIEGNGKGEMTYTIGFMDDTGEYSDMRVFEDIDINRRTEISTVAANTDSTTLRVDEDGDGNVDYVYRAKSNEDGEIVDYSTDIKLLLFPVVLLIAIFLFLLIKQKIFKK